MIMILDTSKLAIERRSEGTRNSEIGRREASAAVERRGQLALRTSPNWFSFELDSQEYVLPIEAVEEIVQVARA